MYLLDTNIISELRKPKPHGAVVAWVQSMEDKDLFLSAVTIGEIQAGIEITREQDTIKAEQIEQWLDLVACSYNVLPMTADIYEDAMIASTAKQHHLTVVTRNTADFKDFGVKLFNPFDGATIF